MIWNSLVKFNMGEEKEFNSLADRYDSLPFLAFCEKLALKNF